MAAKSNAQLTADIIAVITGQTTPESITPITHGALEKDIIDSFYNVVDTPLNRTQTFANAAARAAAVADFIGQSGIQLDTQTYYISTGLAAGNWQLAANTQIQSDTYGVASGIDTYSVTLTPALAAYAAGNSFKVLFTNANTGASSIAVNGLAAKAIRKNGTVALVAGDIQAGTIYTLTYDGTNFQIDNSGFAASSKYKKYVALLTQAGANNPVAIELENTLGGTVVWARASAGTYTGLLLGAYTANKTVCFANNGSPFAAVSSLVQLSRTTSSDVILLRTYDNANVLSDDILFYPTAIEIRVYP